MERGLLIARSPVVLRRPSLAAAAAGWTLAAAATLIAFGIFRAEVCVASSGGVGGCRHPEAPLLELLVRYPGQALLPVAYLLMLLGLAFGAWWLRARTTRRAAILDALLTALYGLLIAAGFAAATPLVLFAPGFLLLGLAVADSPRDLALGALAMVVAWPLAAVGLAVARGTLPPVHAFDQLFGLYWTCGAILGVVFAAVARGAGRRWPLGRGVMTAYGLAAIAAPLALAALVPVFYPSGVYENSGGPSLFVVAGYLSLASALVAPFALRVGLGLRWRAATASAALLLVGFPLGFLLAFAAPSVFQVRLPVL